jgi:hypothetical protein
MAPKFAQSGHYGCKHSPGGVVLWYRLQYWELMGREIKSGQVYDCIFYKAASFSPKNLAKKAFLTQNKAKF